MARDNLDRPALFETADWPTEHHEPWCPNARGVSDVELTQIEAEAAACGAGPEDVARAVAWLTRYRELFAAGFSHDDAEFLSDIGGGVRS